MYMYRLRCCQNNLRVCLEYEKNNATKKGRWRDMPCFCKCHFVHVADVPDCVGPGGPADVDDGLTETRVDKLEVGAGVSMTSTHTRTQ